MFYHPVLLQRQHQMKLLVPWLVSTMGIKKVKKEDIISCNVLTVCDHICSFVVTSSLNPQKRFSLRLSTRLIHGLCLIWREQVIYLQKDIDRILLEREKAADKMLGELLRSQDESVGASPKPKPTTKRIRKTKPQEQDTPESLLERLGQQSSTEREPEFNLDPLNIADFIPVNQAIVQARVAEITLREETVRPEEPRLLDDFGPLEEIVASTNIPDVEMSSKIPEEPLVEKEIVLQSAIPAEKLLGQEEPEQDRPQIPVEEIQEIVEPSELEPAILVVPDIVVTQVTDLEERDKGKEKPVKKNDKRVSPGQKTKPSDDVTQFEVVPVKPKEPTKKNRKTIAASLLLNKKKRNKFVPINQPMQLYKDEPEFIIISNTMPTFKPMKKFWPKWEQERMPSLTVVDDPRPSRDTGSLRNSAVTDKSVGVASKTAETPNASGTSVPLMHQEETPSSDVRITDPIYASTPKKRPHTRDETAEKVLPPAANGDMGPPRHEKKRMKVVSLEEVQAAEVPSKEDGMPEDQNFIPQEHPEIQPEEQMHVENIELSDIGKVTRKPAEQEKSPERVPSDVGGEVTLRPEIEAFGIEWEREIMEVVDQCERITPVDICKNIKKRVTKLNMSIIFSTLLSLAKSEFVLLRSAEDSSELRSAEKGPKEYQF